MNQTGSTCEILNLVAIDGKNYKFLICGVMFVYLALLLLVKLPGIPYNVKEVYSNGSIYIEALKFSLVFFTAFGFPLAMVLYAIKRKRCCTRVILLCLLLHIFFTWLLVRAFLPEESIYDILGYPTWGSWREMELFFRFFGFFGLFSGAMFCLSLGVVHFFLPLDRALKRLTKNICLVYAFALVPASYCIVVILAGTDNIIELLPNEGYSFYCLSLLIYLILLLMSALLVSLLHRLSSFLVFIGVLIVIVAIIPLGFWLVQLGFEQVIFKYEKRFSALQFLLSSNRESYISVAQLFPRFVVAHLGLIFGMAIVQWHIWLSMVRFRAFREV